MRIRSFVSVAVFVLAGALSAQADVIYDSIPSPLPGNLPSQGYQATSTAELGDQITFAGTARQLQTVTVTMSNWALASTYANNPLYTNGSGYVHPLTFNLYGVNSGPSVGTPLASVTTQALIPWRPEADPTCPNPTAWRYSASTCYNGFAFNVTFDFSSLNVLLPNEVIYGLAFNTNTYGLNPIGANGPFESLNFGLSGGASVGTDVNSDVVFWNTSYQGFLTSGKAGVFGPDSGWKGYVPAVRVEASNVPEPTTLGLLALGLVALARRARK